MNIECLCDFIDGRDRFYEGDVRHNFDGDRGQRLLDDGLVKLKGSETPAVSAGGDSAAVDLDVKNVTHGQSSETKEGKQL